MINYSRKVHDCSVEHQPNIKVERRVLSLDVPNETLESKGYDRITAVTVMVSLSLKPPFEKPFISIE